MEVKHIFAFKTAVITKKCTCTLANVQNKRNTIKEKYSYKKNKQVAQQLRHQIENKITVFLFIFFSLLISFNRLLSTTDKLAGPVGKLFFWPTG